MRTQEIVNKDEPIMQIKGNIALSDNGFVFNPSTGDSFTLNKTGREVLALIKEGKNLGEITEYLLKKYDVDNVTIERYLSDFITDLGSNNLMEE
jgi:hypothetical protein